jgi:glycosyltransferase involved in cell wall biosynthesis
MLTSLPVAELNRTHQITWSMRGINQATGSTSVASSNTDTPKLKFAGAVSDIARTQGILPLFEKFSFYGIFPSTDGYPKVGGLGDVAQYMPFAAKQSGVDMRPVFPARKETISLLKVLEVKGLATVEKTDLTIRMPLGNAKTTFDVWQATIKDSTGTEITAYAIDHPAFNEQAQFKFDKSALATHLGLEPETEITAEALSTYPTEAQQAYKQFVQQFVNHRITLGNALFGKATAILQQVLDGKSEGYITEKFPGVHITRDSDSQPLRTFEPITQAAKSQDKTPVQLYVVNDWNPQYGISYLKAHAPEALNDVIVLGFAHNVNPGYSNNSDVKTVAAALDTTPEALNSPDGRYDAADAMLYHSDGLIANVNYAAGYALPDQNGYTSPRGQLIKRQIDRGTLLNVHHGIPPEWFATNHANTALAPDAAATFEDVVDANGKSLRSGTPPSYARLASDALKDIKAFKAANLAAFQADVGLKQDPDAVLYVFAGRLTRQKGFTLIFNAVEQLLANNPHAQVAILASNVVDDGDNHARQFMKEYADKHDIYDVKEDGKTIKKVNLIKNAHGKFENRLFVTAHFDEAMVKRAMAAASYSGMISLFEPFGQVQAQARGNATPTIATWVDGLRDNILDPAHSLELKTSDNKSIQVPLVPRHLSPDDVKSIGQTGWFLDPVKFNVRHYNDHQLNGIQANPERTLGEADNLLLAKLQELYDFAQKDKLELLKVQRNCIQYANKYDTWQGAFETYYPQALLKVVGKGGKLDALVPDTPLKQEVTEASQAGNQPIEQALAIESALRARYKANAATQWPLDAKGATAQAEQDLTAAKKRAKDAPEWETKAESDAKAAEEVAQKAAKALTHTLNLQG